MIRLLSPFTRITKLILILTILQSCTISNKNYYKPSFGARSKIYQNLKQPKKIIKIYLQNSDKIEIERNSKQYISVSNYCQSMGGIYMGYDKPIWRRVEIEAMKLGLEKDSSIFFVCSPKNADFIYEYSYSIKSDGSAINFLFGLSLFVIPGITKYSYDISLKIKDKNYKTIKDLGNTTFNNKVYTSLLFIPVQIVKRSDASEEKVIADIVLDKVIESLPFLEKYLI